MTLWKDLVDIPDHHEDWVLKLNDGLRDDRRRRTVDDYVVTDSLADRFDQALSMLRAGLAVGGVSQPESRGAFLHGSFGSGKSHFMAILGLLLEGYPPARELDNLTPVVTEHDWMDDVEFLRMPFHMIGKASMEQAVFGRYIDWLREEHPDVPAPALYRSEPILENAERMRDFVGDDDRFIDILNGGESEDGGATGPSQSAGGLDWGEESNFEWTLENYNRARDANPRSGEHRDLLSDLIDHVFPMAEDLLGLDDQGFVDFDEGLSRLSHHAREELDKDGVLFFLDELVLWLSREGADPAFVNRELQKVSKLVESEHADRPAPIFSFLARQKDLSEMLGSAVDQESLGRINLSEDYLEKRFEDIRLQARNLPYVASKRLLEPVDDRAAEQIRRGFDETWDSLDQNQRDIVLTNTYDREDFRRVFPFSPALVRALVVLSNELQRERTALDIMQRLLIENRESLELGDVVPVGDLWPMLEEGEMPKDPARKKLFQSARSLRHQNLIPRLENEYDADWQEFERGAPEWQNFRDDLRLMHTLLVAALVSEMPLFENMNAERLLALNHGVEKSPLPGGKGSIAKLREKLRRWSAEISEIHYVESPGEKVELHLEGVDVEHILQKAADNDTQHARRGKVKDLLFDWIELDDTEGPTLRSEHQFTWRGDRRTLEVAYCNVRTRDLDEMEPSGGDRWLIMVDFPFDTGNYNPQDDRQQVQRYRDERGGTRALAWLPLHLNQDGRNLLSRLVRTEIVLKNFSAYTEDLPPDDRPIAKSSLKRDYEVYEQRLRDTLAVAYGLRPGAENDLLDSSVHIDHLQSLADGHEPRLEAGTRFDEVLDDVGMDAFTHTYAASPELPHERLAPRYVEEMHSVVRESIDTGEGVHVGDKALRRRLERYAEPLEIGEMGENRFAHSEAWLHRIDRALEPDDEGLEVGDVFEVVDPPDEPRGLADELRDLVVLAYADMEHMIVTRGGRAEEDIKPGKLRASDRLEYRDLPSEGAWERACRVAEDVFDLDAPPHRNPRTVQQLARDLARAADRNRESARQLAELLRSKAHEHLDMSNDAIRETERWRIADRLSELMEATDEDEPADLVGAVADVDLDSDDRSAVGTAFARASEQVDALNGVSWYVFDKLVNRVGESDDALEPTLDEATSVVATPEHARRLTDLKTIERDAAQAMMEQDDDTNGDNGDDEDGDGETETTGSSETFTAESPDELTRRATEVLEDLGDDWESVEVTIRVASGGE